MKGGGVLGALFTSQAGWSGLLGLLLGVMAVLLVVCLGLWWYARRLRAVHPARAALLERARWGVALFLLGLLVLLVRLEGALYLSSPLVLLGWAGLFLWWVYAMLHWVLRRLPRDRAEFSEAQRRERWVKAKKRR